METGTVDHAKQYRPGWIARFMAWVRGVPPERSLTMADIMIEEFSFLEARYGFRREETHEGPMFTTVAWVSDECRVRATVDAREGADVEVGRRELQPGCQARDLFVIRIYQEQRTLGDIRAAMKARTRPRGFREELKQLACELQTYAAEMLRGDLSLLDRLDEEYRKLS